MRSPARTMKQRGCICPSGRAKPAVLNWTMMINLNSTETIYKGRVFDVRLDSIREGDLEYKREIVVHKGSAVIVPVFDDETVGFVRQYRHAVGDHMLEIPAGGIEEGETFEQAALRELEEEVGVEAASIELLSEFYVSPGFLTEKMYLYLATGLTETTQNLDHDEAIEIERISFSDALDQIRNGQINDAKTIVGLMLAGSRLGLAI